MRSFIPFSFHSGPISTSSTSLLLLETMGDQRVLPYKIAREPNRERWASAGVRLVGLCFDIQDTAENVDFDIFILFRGCVYGVWSIIFRAPLSMTNDDGCIPGLVP